MTLLARTHPPMTNGLALIVHWSVRQKLNRARSVQLRRYERALTYNKRPTIQHCRWFNTLTLYTHAIFDLLSITEKKITKDKRQCSTKKVNKEQQDYILLMPEAAVYQTLS